MENITNPLIWKVVIGVGEEIKSEAATLSTEVSINSEEKSANFHFAKEMCKVKHLVSVFKFVFNTFKSIILSPYLTCPFGQ